MSDLISILARLQIEAVSSLRTMATPEGLSACLEEMGYRGLDPAPLTEALSAVQSVMGTVDILSERLIYSRPALEDIPGLIIEVAELIDEIRQFEPDLSGLDPALQDPAFWAEFGLHLADHMVREMLGRRLPILGVILFAIGIIRIRDVTDEPDGREGLVETFDFGAIDSFLSDPGGTLATRFGPASSLWTREELDFLARHLGRAGVTLRERALSSRQAAAVSTMTVEPGQPFYELLLLEGQRLGTLTPREAGLRVLPSPATAEMGFGIYATSDIGQTGFDLNRDWSVALSSTLEDIVQLTVDGSGATFEPQDVTVEASIQREATGSMILIGEADKTRLSLEDLDVHVGIALSTTGVGEIIAGAALTGLELMIVPGDNFLSEILGDEFGTSLDIAVDWSSVSGVTFGGSLGFQFTLPTEITIGPITLDGIGIAVEVIDTGPRMTVTSGILGDFGPFDLRVGDMGLQLAFSEASDGKGLIGPYDMNAGFKPPTEFGLSIDLPSVKGGGFLDIDGGRYAGTLAVEVVSVGIAVITVVDTELPDDPDGWAFFAALTLTFPAIPLGFGFTLSGLGGLIAINRGIDTQAIAAGLKSGSVDALLFPDDPVNDAPQLISMIDDYFPILPGNTVIGPIIELGWGAPKTLVTAQLGVIISAPEGKIALLGSIGVNLPDPDAPILTLNMDIVGEIDLPAGTMFMQASLRDSLLLGIIELSGDMGMYLAVGDQPYFLFSVGGYHPGFEPPSQVPATLHDLDRMRAAIQVASNVSVTLTTYFAITSNTVQFGAGVEMEASVKVLIKTYTARGYLEFDVLLRFSPFAVIADFEAGVGIYSGNKELMGVHLAAHLEGPEPWYVSGQATFRFFGIDVNFNVEVGGTAPSEPKEIVHLRQDVLEALSAIANWQEEAPVIAVPSAITFVEIEADPDNPRLLVRPDRRVRVAQSVAPLNKTIEVVGQGLPAPDNERFAIDGSGLGDTAATPEIVQEWFAPAQWESMGREEKLSRASFEEMDAGVAFGAAGIATTAFPDALGREAPLAYEEVLWEDASPVVLKQVDGALRLAALSGAAARALSRSEPLVSGEFSVVPAAFAVVDNETGLASAGISQPVQGVDQTAAFAMVQSGEQRVVSAAALALDLGA